MSLITRFIVCTLIVAATSVLAAFAWDRSDANTAQAAVNRQSAEDAARSEAPDR